MKLVMTSPLRRRRDTIREVCPVHMYFLKLATRVETSTPPSPPREWTRLAIQRNHTEDKQDEHA